MKRIVLLFITLILAIALVSCSSDNNRAVRGDSDAGAANKRMEMVLDALENEDSQKLKQLFSEKAIDSADNFDENIKLLFEYFNGDVVSYNDWNALSVLSERDGNVYIKTFDSTYDVETTGQKYRFAIHDVVEDTADNDNVGIWSLYIIKMEDDTDPRFAYRGDSKNTPGINIGVKNVIPQE